MISIIHFFHLHKISYTLDNVLEALVNFKVDREYFETSLDLIIQYLLKKPSLYPQVLKYLIDDLSFTDESHAYSYYFQNTLWKYLFDCLNDSHKKEMSTNLILNIATHYLKSVYEYTSMEDKKTFTFQKIFLRDTDVIKHMREKIWNFLFEMYDQKQYKNYIIEIMQYYIKNNSYPINKEILQFDASFILPFINNKFDRTNFQHSMLVTEYIQFIDRVGIDRNDYQNIEDEFRNETFKIYDLLTIDFLSIEPRKSHEDFEKFKREQIHNNCEKYNLDDYKDFFTKCNFILDNTTENKKSSIQTSINILLIDVLEKDESLFLDLIKHFINNNNFLKLDQPNWLFNKFFEKSKKLHLELYELLKNYKYYLKDYWLHSFFENLPEGLVNEYYLNELYDFINNLKTERNFIININYDFLEKFHGIDSNIYIYVLSTLLEKSKTGICKINFQFLFWGDRDLKLDIIFNNNIDLLKQLFIYQDEFDEFTDYEGIVFKYILSRDINFIIEYLKKKIGKARYISSIRVKREFNFIWRMKNCTDIINTVVNYFIKHDDIYTNDFLVVFFRSKGDKGNIDQKLSFVRELINNYYNSIRALELIFYVIADCYPEKRKEYLAYFLKKNQDFDVFNKLPFEKQIISGAGTFVPYYEECKKFWESLLDIFTGIEFLEHKYFVEKKIEGYMKLIEDENKRAFIDEYT